MTVVTAQQRRQRSAKAAGSTINLKLNDARADSTAFNQCIRNTDR